MVQYGDTLLVALGGGTPLPLLPQGARHFLLGGTRTQFEFLIQNGTPSAVVVTEDGRQAVYTRIDTTPNE